MTSTPLSQLSEEERLFSETVRQFAEDTIRPKVREMDEAGTLDPGIIPPCFELGLMGIEIPEPYGGSGASFFLACLAVEELSRVDPSVGVFVDVQNTLFNNCLLRWGNEEQKERYAPRAAADSVGAYALSESSSGSDAFSMTTRAEERGGGWVLNGSKLWITNGAEAELYVVFATVDPEAGHRGVTAFLVEREFPGFAVGEKEEKLGIRASSTTELLLDDCEVPSENVLGEVGKGYKVAMETLNEGRIGIGAQMVGCAQGALDAALGYSREREAFGKPIAEFQGVQFDLARMATELQAARLAVYDAARRKDAGLPFMKEAAMAKVFSSEVAERITGKAIEIYGGYGYTKDYPVEKYWRDAKIGQIYEGTSNMQLQTIARSLMG
ncbi:MAG: acyl-CoA dehydrogenase [Gemmatimonadota bacterium]|nr:acyl-CoA dehydrogenase [Gemmatimonadota bacterium]